GAAEKAKRGILLRRQRRFVDREGRKKSGRPREPRLSELLDEIHPHAAGQKDVDGVRLGGRDLGELRREIELVQRNINFICNLALEESRESGQRVLARLIVGRHQENFLDPAVLGILARDREHLIVLVGGDEEIWVAFFAGEVRRASIGADQDCAALGGRLHDRRQHVGKDRTDYELDLIALDERL